MATKVWLIVWLAAVVVVAVGGHDDTKRRQLAPGHVVGQQYTLGERVHVIRPPLLPRPPPPVAPQTRAVVSSSLVSKMVAIYHPQSLATVPHTSTDLVHVFTHYDLTEHHLEVVSTDADAEYEHEPSSRQRPPRADRGKDASGWPTWGPVESNTDDDDDGEAGAGDHDEFTLRQRLGRGAYGEIWTARRASAAEGEGGEASGAWYVMKRLFVEKGEHVHLSGLREIHFGVRLKGVPHVARFVTYFEEADPLELWLVFRYEGVNLQLIMASGHGAIASEGWHAVRDNRKNITRQVLQAVAAAHARGITHRDIKSANVLLTREHHVSVCDWGSAIDDDVLAGLYGSRGPTQDEATAAYAPPEVLFTTAPCGTPRESYDLWSVGVLMLELLAGTDDVFRVSSRTRAVLQQRLRGHSASVIEKAVLFRALVEYCIYDPAATASSATIAGDEVSPTNRGCSAGDLADRVLRLDPLGEGMNKWELDLVRRLLEWRPERRLAAADALTDHAYFTNPHTCPVCGAEFATSADLATHKAYFKH